MNHHLAEVLGFAAVPDETIIERTIRHIQVAAEVVVMVLVTDLAVLIVLAAHG